MTIYDTVHGYIDIDSELFVKDIIDTPEFQRLRNIKQLGVCEFVFPSAKGSRFEHSIGVYYLATRMINAILKNTKHLCCIDNDIELIKVAALIHDIGHGPFSHVWDVFCKNNDQCEEHEYRSFEIFKHMNIEYGLGYTDKEMSKIAHMIQPTKDFIKPKDNNYWMYQIVANISSGLDVDKMDYVLRDCPVIGLEINKEDVYRVIDSTKVVDNTITFPDKAFYSRTIFNIFETRYKLHKDLYQHPTVRGIELQILDALQENSDELESFLTPCCFENYIKEFCMLDDSIIERIQFGKKPGHELITLLKGRVTYKVIGTYRKEEDTKDLLVQGVIDHVKLSYNSEGTNPMENILFYREDDSTTGANSTTYIEPKSYCVKFVRMYKKLE